MTFNRAITVYALAVAIVASALMVTIIKDWNRAAFIELDDLQSENTALRVEWGRLQIEYGAFEMDGRIEMLAHARLGMTHPREIIVVEVP